MDEATKAFIKDFFKGATAWGREMEVSIEDIHGGGLNVTLHMAFESSGFELPANWECPTPPWERICFDCHVVDDTVEMFGDLPFCSKHNPSPWRKR